MKTTPYTTNGTNQMDENVFATCLKYTQSWKNCNINSWIFYGVEGQGHVTRSHENSAYIFSSHFYIFGCSLLKIV